MAISTRGRILPMDAFPSFQEWKKHELEILVIYHQERIIELNEELDQINQLELDINESVTTHDHSSDIRTRVLG